MDVTKLRYIVLSRNSSALYTKPDIGAGDRRILKIIFQLSGKFSITTVGKIDLLLMVRITLHFE